MHTSRPSPHRRAPAFSLVELLVVVSIMAILAAISLPSLQNITGSTGRRGAVNVLLATFEQARAAALESGTTTYVGFADRNFPDETLRYRAFIVFRDRTEDDSPPAGDPAATLYIPLTKWETLPRMISLKNEPLSILGDYFLTIPDASLPKFNPGGTLPVLAFNASGSLHSAHSAQKMRLFIYEGFFANGQDNFSRQAAFQRSHAGLFERITFSRYTGRARLDVATTP
jgi:prepilin-type N-terminal cleavage/methylation domain-containing protein